MNYKKIIKNKKVRFRILSFLKFIPDKYMLYMQYYIKMKKKLNIKNPKRYTEKIQWYKLYYRNKLMPQCADKYYSREYVKQKGFEYILNDLYTVFEDPDSITFDNLPREFVLKLSNCSSTNYICKNKEEVNVDTIRTLFKDYKKQSQSKIGREWPYYEVDKPVILAERFLTDTNNPDGQLTDYKILCFDGKVEYTICVDGRNTNNYRHIVYDSEWNKMDVRIFNSSNLGHIKKPTNYEEMKYIAEKLSEEFPAARIDLYSINNKIYFGEITFFPWSGYMDFTPDKFDFELGNKFVLLEKKYV